MIREPKDVLDDVRTAVRSRPGDSISGLVADLISGLCMYAQFPEDAFERLASLLGEPAFRAHEGAWELVGELDSSWALLSDEQRGLIRPILIDGFDKWANPMGAFISGEILGGRYCDEAALAALTALAVGASMSDESAW
ncbi:hypothetical protein ACLESD_00410 [Pyxidicoccus sp. 3LFB2]